MSDIAAPETNTAGTPAPAAPPAAPPSDGPKAWWSSIPDEGVRGLMEAKGYKGPEDVATAYYHANKLLKGATDVVSIPKIDDADGFRSVMAKLGMPEEASKYDLGLPEGTQVDEDFAANAKAWAHKAGLTQAQLKGFVAEYQNYVLARGQKDVEASQARVEAEIAEVKKAWGADWDRNVAAGQNAVKALGLDKAFMERLEGAAGDAVVLELMAKLGKTIGVEDRTIVAGGEGFGMSPEAARAKIADIKLGRDPDFLNAMRDPRHPSHKDVTERWRRWHEIGGTR